MRGNLAFIYVQARQFKAALRVDGATVEAHGDTVTLVLAPTAALARRVLASASGT